MILEFSLDYRSNSLVYERLFLDELKTFDLEGSIVKKHFNLKLFVKASTVEELKRFSDSFSKNLPHSIFLHDTKASVINEMPNSNITINKTQKLSLPPCPKCLAKIKESYNIFVECDACGYGVEGIEKSYQDEFIEIANGIKEGKVVELNSFYGKYFVGVPSKICNTINYDIMAYDLATVEKYSANIQEYELKALGAFEKPIIELKKKINFTMDYEEIEAEILRFRLTDDAIFTLLMEELHHIGVDLIFVSQERVETDRDLLLTKVEHELEPIEVVASPNDILIVKGNRGLPPIEQKSSIKNQVIRDFYAVIDEHQLKEQHENIAGINLAKEYHNSIMVYGKKYDLIEYLSFDFHFDSIADIFTQIEQSDEKAKRLLDNYRAKFPEHCSRIDSIVFDASEFNLYRLWGVIAIILEFTPSHEPFDGARVLEQNALEFLGKNGPRIDYKLISKNNKIHLDPLMTIKTAMSFRLAGVDTLGLSYGVIESFLEFLDGELDELKQNMSVTAIVATGSMLSNKKIFAKLSQEVSINHYIHFNNELPLIQNN